MSARTSAIALLVAAVAFAAHAQEAGSNSTAKVLIAGTGTEPHINTVMDGIVDQLKAAGIAVRPLQSDGKSRTAAVEALKTSQADSLLYVTVNITMGQKDGMDVQCFDKDGKQLWEEDGSGGMAFSATASAKNMIKNIKKKLDKHIGQPGLPKS